MSLRGIKTGSRRRPLRALAGPAAATVLLLVAPARADGDNTAAADALFQQAKTLTEQQRWGEACPKFDASYKLDKTLGTLLNLADCEEHVGRVATAWAHWGEAVELAEKGGDKRATFASGRRAALAKRLPMVQVDVPAGKSSLEIYRDGVRIDPAAYGVPLPSDPGPHTLSVRRGAEVLAEKSVVASEAKTSTASFDLAAIERAAPPPQAPVTAPSWQRTAGFAVLGVGAAAFAAAGVLEILAITSKSAATAPDACVNGFCTKAGIDAIGRARTFANAGQWVGVGGLVVAAVGVTIVLISPASRPPAARSAAALSVSGWAGRDGGGLSLRGAFR